MIWGKEKLFRLTNICKQFEKIIHQNFFSEEAFPENDPQSHKS